MRLNIFSAVEYAVFLTAAIFLLVFFHSYFMFFLFVFLVVLPGVSIYAEFYAKKHIHCTISIDKKSAAVMEQATASVTIHNSAWFPLLGCTVSLQVQNHFYPDGERVNLRIPALAKQSNTVCFPLESNYCGAVELKLLCLQFYDMLHLLMLKKIETVQSELSIMPEEISIPIPTALNQRYGSSETSSDAFCKGNSENMVDIRTYRPGDRLQHVHWKLSAKKEELLVKEFEATSRQSVCLLLELERTQNLNGVLNCLYTFCLRTLEKERQLIVNWWSESEQQIRTKCLQVPDELEGLFWELYQEYSYQSSAMAKQNFQAETAGFTDFYYIKATEGVAAIVLEET